MFVNVLMLMIFRYPPKNIWLFKVIILMFVPGKYFVFTNNNIRINGNNSMLYFEITL